MKTATSTILSDTFRAEAGYLSEQRPDICRVESAEQRPDICRAESAEQRPDICRAAAGYLPSRGRISAEQRPDICRLAGLIESKTSSTFLFFKSISCRVHLC